MGLVDVTARYADADALKSQLWDHYQIEIPVIVWQQRTFLRVSTHAYTTEQHVLALIRALQAISPQP